MGKIQTYIENILPSFLDDPAAKNYLESFAQASEDLIAEMQFARDEGLIAKATPDTFDRHLRNSSLLRSPFENDLVLRNYLLQRFSTWRHGGSVKQLQNELARFGYKRTKVVTWTDLIQQGVTHPFAGGFTTIVGVDVNGGVRYMPLQPGLSIEHKTLGANSPLRLGSAFPNFWVELQTDGTGFAISTPIEILSAIQRDPLFSQHLGCGFLGDGKGKAVPSSKKPLPFGYFSFFYVDIDTPNGFEKPIFWDEGDELTYDYLNTTTAVSWKYMGTLFKDRFNVAFLGIWGPNSNNLWVTSLGGYVLHWDGNAWSYTNIAFGDLAGIYGFSANDIWVVNSTRSQVYHFDGATWKPTKLPFTRWCLSVWGSDPKNVWVVGDFGEIAYFDGSTWAMQASPTKEGLQDVFGFGPNDVWAVGAHGTILHFDGTKWSSVPSPATEWLTSIYGLSPNDVWIGTANAGILHWNGTTWTVAVTPAPWPNEGIGKIFGIAANDLWASTGGSYLWHYDGVSWKKEFSPCIAALNAAIAFSPTDIWAVGNENALCRYGDFPIGTWTVAKEAPGSGLLDVHGSSDSNIWAVGIAGQIWRYNGIRWSQLTSGTTADLRAVWVFSETNVWVVGTVGTILQWDGTTFIDRSLGPHDFNDLVGFYHSDIWFVGNNGTTVQWNGTKLTSVSSGTTKDLYTIAGHQNYRMLAGGQNGILIRYDDTTGTRKWTSVVSPTTQDIRSIWAEGLLRFYLCGENNTLFFWDSKTFTPISLGLPGEDFFSVYGLSPNDVWVGAPDTFYHFDGINWTKTSTPAPDQAVSGFFGTNYRDVWAISVPTGATSGKFFHFASQLIQVPRGGTGPLWDTDIHFWDLTPPYQNAYSDLKKLIRKFKPVTMSCRFVRIRIGNDWITVPIGEEWEEDTEGNVPDFFTSSY